MNRYNKSDKEWKMKKTKKDEEKLQNRANLLYPNTKEKMTKHEKQNLIKQVIGSVRDFKKNYEDSREANVRNSDKYFHSKANCEATQRGTTGKKMAELLSNSRELYDYHKKTKLQKQSKEDVLKDSKEDQEANEYGRKQALKNPNVNCKILVNKYRVNGLGKKY